MDSHDDDEDDDNRDCVDRPFEGLGVFLAGKYPFEGGKS